MKMKNNKDLIEERFKEISITLERELFYPFTYRQ